MNKLKNCVIYIHRFIYSHVEYLILPEKTEGYIIQSVVHTDFINNKNTVKNIMDVKIQGNNLQTAVPYLIHRLKNLASNFELSFRNTYMIKHLGALFFCLSSFYGIY